MPQSFRTEKPLGEKPRPSIKPLWYAVLVVLGLWINVAPAGATPDTLAAFTEHLEQRIPQLMQDYAVPGMSIAVIQAGEPIWLSAYGYADLASNREMTVDTFYRTQSISKSVTAWGVMRLVERGLIDLDASVTTYLNGGQLPDSDYTEQAVTVRRLLSNSAGMPLGDIRAQYSPRGPVPALRDTVLAEARLGYEPGTDFAYSNTGFNLLELVIEEVTGRGFAEYMAAEILLPLGMQDASFAWSEAVDTRMATGYDLKGMPVDLYVYPEKASGGLLASVEAVAYFVSASMVEADQNVLEPASVKMLHTPVTDVTGIFSVVSDTYGFGHFLETLPNGQQAAWHGGQGNGWMTHFHTVPESGDGIVILTNSQRSWPAIAEVLGDWAEWAGVGAVKMRRIADGMIVMHVLIGLVWVLVFIQVYRLLRGLSRGQRRWVPLSWAFDRWRWLQTGLAVGMLALLVWGASGLYLMLAAVFPDMIEWLSISLAVLTGLIILDAQLPYVKAR